MSVGTANNQVGRFLSDGAAHILAQRFAALGDPTRVKLVHELAVRGEAPVQDLASAVDAPLPNVSKHLQVLHHAAIVARRRRGTYVHYRLRDEQVLRLVGTVFRFMAGGG
jgi:DNA-binding transcriptional ArsR family regulator